MVEEELMKKSYRARPEPCRSMKITVEKTIHKSSEDFIKIIVNFPVDFTDFKQERVN